MIERTVYQCEHCKKYRTLPKIYFSQRDMYLHECNCYYNLENKTCFTCKYNQRLHCENICELHLKDNIENNTYHKNDNNDFLGGVDGYYGNKYGISFPVSKQIVSGCEHWEDSRDIDG